MTNVCSLPVELHAYICAFLPPVTREIAAMAWRGFGTVGRMKFSKAASIAAASDDVPALDLLARTRRSISKNISNYAIIGGAINALRWAHARNYMDPIANIETAAVHGQIECLKYIMLKYTGFNFKVPFRAAIKYGNIECAIILRECAPDVISKTTYRIDAADGGIASVKYLRKIGLIYKYDQIIEIMDHCSTECIEYMFSHGITLPIQKIDIQHRSGCALSKLKAIAAAGYAITAECIGRVLEADCVRCATWMQDRGIVISEKKLISCGAINCLKHYHSTNPQQMGPDDLIYAIDRCMLEMVKYIHRAGVYCSAACARASYGGRLKILLWLIRKGGYNIYDEYKFIHGDLQYIKVLRTVRRAGHEWPDVAIMYAAQRADIMCLKYIHKHRPNIDFGAYTATVIAAHDICIQQNGYISNDCSTYMSHERALDWINATAGLNARLHRVHEVDILKTA